MVNALSQILNEHPNLSFTDYINQCRNIITTTRKDLKQHANLIIEANTPFELRPTQTHPKKGILLIHGLLDCPSVMRDIGIRLQQQGYLVRAILLPGQGTVPEDLLHIKMEDWVQTVNYGIASLAKEVDSISLIGFSTGGSLAIRAMLDKTLPQLANIICLAPAIKIRNLLDFTTGWYPVLGRIWQRANWLHLTKEIDYCHYESVPFNAAYQVYRLSRLIKKLSDSQPSTCPMFFILSHSDSIISSHAAIHYFQHHLRSDNQLLLYSNLKTHETNPNTIVRDTQFPNWHIQHFSHVCLPIAPDNPHYGINGDFVEASHVDHADGILFGSMNKLQAKVYDLLFKLKLIKQQRKRLTFNPDFEFMMDKIIEFLK